MESFKVDFLIVIATCLLGFCAQSGKAQFQWGKKSGLPETEELMSSLQDYAERRSGSSAAKSRPVSRMKYTFHAKFSSDLYM